MTILPPSLLVGSSDPHRRSAGRIPPFQEATTVTNPAPRTNAVSNPICFFPVQAVQLRLARLPKGPTSHPALDGTNSQTDHTHPPPCLLAPRETLQWHPLVFRVKAQSLTSGTSPEHLASASLCLVFPTLCPATPFCGSASLPLNPGPLHTLFPLLGVLMPLLSHLENPSFTSAPQGSLHVRTGSVRLFRSSRKFRAFIEVMRIHSCVICGGNLSLPLDCKVIRAGIMSTFLFTVSST